MQTKQFWGETRKISAQAEPHCDNKNIESREREKEERSGTLGRQKKENMDINLLLGVLTELTRTGGLFLPNIERFVNRASAAEEPKAAKKPSSLEMRMMAQEIRPHLELGKGISSLYQDLLNGAVDSIFESLVKELPADQTVYLAGYLNARCGLAECRSEFGAIVNQAGIQNWAEKTELTDLYRCLFLPQPLLPIEKKRFEWVSEAVITEAQLKTVAEGNNCPLCKYDNAKGFYINAGQWIKCGHCNPDQQKAEKRPTASRKEMPVAEYLENPNLCPFCRSEEITTTGEIFYPDDFCGEYRQNVKCLACQRGWADCYTLSHFIPHAG